jgi:hypothetical protein
LQAAGASPLTFYNAPHEYGFCWHINHISPVAHLPSLQRMGVATNGAVNVGQFSERQRRFLEYHRNSVLLMAAH